MAENEFLNFGEIALQQEAEAQEKSGEGALPPPGSEATPIRNNKKKTPSPAPREENSNAEEEEEAEENSNAEEENYNLEEQAEEKEAEEKEAEAEEVEEKEEEEVEEKEAEEVEENYNLEEQAEKETAVTAPTAIAATTAAPKAAILPTLGLLPPAAPLVNTSKYNGVNLQQLVNSWTSETNLNERNALIETIKKRQTIPGFYNSFLTETSANGSGAGAYMDTLYDTTGTYPSPEDPNFISRLLAKQEFRDTQSPSLENDPDAASNPDFEITPVQRFIANFMHPKTPYKSVLLYHGVGVGKTCTAIQAAESYLDMYPERKVIIVAPPAIQGGFLRTIFDSSPEALIIGKGDAPNRCNQCTGDTYLRLTGCMYERDINVIEKKVEKAIKRRYELMGYRRLGNTIKTEMDTAKGDFNRENRALQKKFNYRLLIIDEAHNLREVQKLDAKSKKTAKEALEEVEETEGGDAKGGTTEEAAAELASEKPKPKAEAEEKDTTEEEKGDLKDAKFLVPYLLRLLNTIEGMRLMLMTATPMFNSVYEITFLLSLLMMNDGKTDNGQPPLNWSTLLKSEDELKEERLYNLENDDKPLEIFKNEKAKETLGRVASAYVSFMRGENPNSFPIRLYPLENRLTAENYPFISLYQGTSKEKAARATLGDDVFLQVTEKEKENMAKLPIVVSTVREGTDIGTVLAKLYRKVQETGLSINTQNDLVGFGNCVFPGERTGKTGFVETFGERPPHTPPGRDSSWMKLENLDDYAPKIATAIRSFNKAKGVCFLYSRFVYVGAYITALLLEANGYKRYGAGPLLKLSVPIDAQCALCENKQTSHDDSDHKFTQATYILLTGESTISPNNEDMIRRARAEDNRIGAKIKVVLGSQIAGEGLDLRFIREVHILDAWYHLNKTEQIIGRGIRFNSHRLLDSDQRNCTVFLHALKFEGFEEFEELNQTESADLYCYRVALQKAIYVGQVSRVLKIHAMDCNLRKGVTVISSFKKRRQVDSHGVPRTSKNTNTGANVEEISVNDTPFTAICDWMENCNYTCAPDLTISELPTDQSTYDTYGVKYKETILQRMIRDIFSRQPFVDVNELVTTFLSRKVATPLGIELVLRNIVNNRLFRINVGGKQGYIILKNGYLIFQPYDYGDVTVPLAIRILEYPIKKDEYTAEAYKKPLTAPATVTAKPEVSQSEIVRHLINVWTTLKAWTAKCVEKKGNIELDIVISIIEKNMSDFKQYLEALRDRLIIIRLFCASVLTASDTEPIKTILKKIILEYFWDEWFSVSQQILLLQNAIEKDKKSDAEPTTLFKDDFEIISADQKVNLEEGTFLYIDPFTNELKESSYTPSRVEGAKLWNDIELQDEGLAELPKPRAGEASAGDPYGFLVPKRGTIVFKTQSPFKLDKKKQIPDSGLECANVSNNTSPAKLKRLGKILNREVPVVKKDESDESLPKIPEDKKLVIPLLQGEIIDRTPQLNNSNSRCTLLDILLRFMDEYLKSMGRRWFFRPVDAYLSSHKGIVSDEVRFAKVRQEQKVEKALKKGNVKKPKENAEAAAAAAKKKADAEAAKAEAKAQRERVKAAEKVILEIAKKKEPSEENARRLEAAKAELQGAEEAKAAKAAKPTKTLKKLKPLPAEAAAPVPGGKARHRTMRQRK